MTDDERETQTLRDAVTHLCAAGKIDEGTAVEALLQEVLRLRKVVAPACPHCHTTMIPTRFKGYYDEFDYWGCACDTLPKVAETHRGCFG